MRKKQDNMTKKISVFNFFSAVVACSTLLIACGQGATTPGEPAGHSGGDSSSAKTIVKYARGFTIDYYDHYKLVHILNHTGDVIDTLEYILAPKGVPPPPGHPKAEVIRIPVQTMVVMSSMHVAMADFAGVGDRITGLGSFQYINSPLVRNNIKQGKVKQVGLDGNLNNELLITMHPDLVMAMTNPDAGSGKYKTLTDAGIPVVFNAEWLESTPLGRAEWVKLVAAFAGTEELVNRKFDSVEQSYNKLAQLGAGAKQKPRVIIGMPYKGSWFTPAGDSYMAHFLHDAGAAYKWAGTKGVGSLSLNFETVAPEALEADYWLNIGYVESKKDITGKDPRYGSFKAFTTGQLYNNTARTNDLGSNDYWESGAVNPQVVLADMIRILHPDLLPDHALVYYKQLQ